jgi:hypothetical protein
VVSRSSGGTTPLTSPNVAASVHDSNARLSAMMRSADFAEGVAALTERRPPRFPDAAPHGDR